MGNTTSKSFNLPGRFGFGRTRVDVALDNPLVVIVSICQADLGLAELVSYTQFTTF